MSLSSLFESLEMSESDGGGFKGVTVLAVKDDTSFSFPLSLLIPNLSLTIWVDTLELCVRDDEFC